MASPLHKSGILGVNALRPEAGANANLRHEFFTSDNATGTAGDKVLVVRSGSLRIETADTLPAGTTIPPSITIEDRIRDTDPFNTQVLTTATRIERTPHQAILTPSLLTGPKTGGPLNADLNDHIYSAEQLFKGVRAVAGGLVTPGIVFPASTYVPGAITAGTIVTVIFDATFILKNNTAPVGADVGVYRLRFAAQIQENGGNPEWDISNTGLNEETIQVASALETFSLTATGGNLEILIASSVPTIDRNVAASIKVFYAGPETLRPSNA
jgi:hypothetical protein